MALDEQTLQNITTALGELRTFLKGKDPGWIVDSVFNLKPLPRENLAKTHVDTPDPLDNLIHLLADLNRWTPDNNAECERLRGLLSLTDIENFIIFTIALRKAKRSTEWFHHNLASVSNRILLSSVVEARLPCILHSLLTLQYRINRRLNEPLARSIMARELRNIAPYDAIRNGLEGLALGYDLAYTSVISAVDNLSLIPKRPPTERGPGLAYFKDVAVATGLPFLKEDDITSSDKAASIRVTTVVPGETRSLKTPIGDDYYYMFKNKKINLPDIKVFEIENGTISIDTENPGRTSFYVYDQYDKCISDLSVGISPFILDNRICVDGNLGFIGDKHSGPINIAHFLLDNLPRIPILTASRAENLRFLVCERHDYYKRIFEIAGLSSDIYYAETKKCSIRADRLLISSNSLGSIGHPANCGADWALGFLRDRLLGKTQPPSRRKIFISRADTGSRNILNGEEVEREMKTLGYETVTLANRDIEDQIEMFRSASHVIGVHGAGLTNVLFSSPGTRVLEILPPLIATSAFWTISSQLGHVYGAMVADDPETQRPDYTTWSHQKVYNSRNVVVAVDRLKALLDEMDRVRTNLL